MLEVEGEEHGQGPEVGDEDHEDPELPAYSGRSVSIGSFAKPREIFTSIRARRTFLRSASLTHARRTSGRLPSLRGSTVMMRQEPGLRSILRNHGPRSLGFGSSGHSIRPSYAAPRQSRTKINENSCRSFGHCAVYKGRTETLNQLPNAQIKPNITLRG